MKVIKEIPELQSELRNFKTPFSLIPTMGCLHKGHLSLINKAKENKIPTVCSIFVNPTQFNNLNDFQQYPSNLNNDLKKLEDIETDIAFIPNKKDIYPLSNEIALEHSPINSILCAKTRPGHFSGVLTIMMKLLQITKAPFCYMGEKDYQQLKLIEDMCTEFFLDTKIVACPTLREESGLAMSSRNERLTENEKIKASQIYKILKAHKNLNDCIEAFKRQNFKIDYIEEHWGRRFAAVFINETRLIDNIKIEAI